MAHTNYAEPFDRRGQDIDITPSPGPCEPSSPREDVGDWTNGPFVTLAVLCRGIHVQPDGTLDVEGIIRSSLILDTESDASEQVRAFRCVAVLGLHAGLCQGAYAVALRCRQPSGRHGQMVARLAEFSADAPDIVLQFALTIDLDGPGAYWVDVLVERRLLTRMVLRTVEGEGGGVQVVVQ